MGRAPNAAKPQQFGYCELFALHNLRRETKNASQFHYYLGANFP